MYLNLGEHLYTLFFLTSVWWLTCREHLLVDARGSDRYIKVSKVRDLRWQVRHCTVDLNWPWNSATMMDSFNSLCLLQATSAAVWSSRWSFSSSLYRFRLSAWQQRNKNVWNMYNSEVIKLNNKKKKLIWVFTVSAACSSASSFSSWQGERH